jgi:hypothetical protein
MSAFGGKADIFVILSAISLRQCRSMRRRIAKPAFGLRPGIGSNALIALLDEYQNVIRRHVLDFVTRRADAPPLVRHGVEFSRAGLQANSRATQTQRQA